MDKTNKTLRPMPSYYLTLGKSAPPENWSFCLPRQPVGLKMFHYNPKLNKANKQMASLRMF